MGLPFFKNDSASPLGPGRKAVFASFGIAAVLIVLVVGAYLYDALGSRTRGGENQDIGAAASGEPVVLEPTDLPSGFKANKLPLETNVPILENYNILLDDGGIQSVRTYVSENEADESKAAYKGYLKENKWDILVEEVVGGEHVISARSEEYEGAMLNVMVRPAEEGRSIVSIYLIRRPL